MVCNALSSLSGMDVFSHSYVINNVDKQILHYIMKPGHDCCVCGRWTCTYGFYFQLSGHNHDEIVSCKLTTILVKVDITKLVVNIKQVHLHTQDLHSKAKVL